ncbi:5'-3' exonuclease [Brevibacterium jeotgali]|uniref:5'-3' exonuclease n=1 Tax=Brevibacterium jeotgali TaxID=1262550 RepID=A0A2H1L297_9MICO|nr:5'-3' exonuclease [Brevibacterium jeotgali]SMY10845.1 5'-3' exonuclease [Brevibacterium jeotgali]
MALVTPPLLVLDTPALYYRSFHGLPDTIRSPHGRPVNAAKGLLDTISQLVGRWDSRRIIAVMDADWRPDFRTALLPEYKAHRITDPARGTETPPELEAQLPVIFDALDAFGIPIAEVPGTEADDVIASIVAQGGDEDIVVVSSDRDLLALLAPGRRVCVHRPRTGGRWETTALADLPAAYGVADGDAYRALAALRGDPSDGIPGVPGIGEKTAARLVAGYGGLDAIIAAAQRGDKEHGLSARRRENILAHADGVRAGERVMEGLTDLAVSDFVAAAGGEPDTARIAELSGLWGLERSVARLLATLTGDDVEVQTTEHVRATAEPVVGGAPVDRAVDSTSAGWAADFCAFDLETTGVDPHTGRIVSAALLPFAGGDEGPARTWLVDPGVEIPEAAQRVHGISTERARAEGQPTAVALPQIMDAVCALSASGTTLVGHNIVYDLTVLAAEAVRAGILPSPDSLLDRLPPVLDTLVVDREVDTYRRGPRTLGALAQHYGVSLDDAHDALEDARAAGLIALALARSSPALAETPAVALHDQQTVWKREQAASLQEFLRRRRPTAVVSGDWPLERLD